MIQLSDAQKAEFFHRSYLAVDGLWFMKVEEALNFETALDIDDAVWKIIPKIQARLLREMTGREKGLEALRECFEIKLALEGFEFELGEIQDGKSFEVAISRCPWIELLKKANRGHLAERIGTRICTTECGGWAAQFGPGIKFDLPEQLCKGGCACRFRFSQEG